MCDQDFEIIVEADGRIKLPKEVIDKMKFKEGDIIHGYLAKQSTLDDAPHFHISANANFFDEIFRDQKREDRKR